MLFIPTKQGYNAPIFPFYPFPVYNKIMIKHILKIIRNERSHNTGIWVELFLVSVFLWYIVDYTYVVISNYYKPMNFDIRHTYELSFGKVEDKTHARDNIPSVPLGESFDKIMGRMRQNPMIEAASLSILSRPHIGSHSTMNLFRDTLQSVGLERMVTPDFFHVFRYKSVNGSTEELVEALKKDEFIISKSIEKELFPDGSSAKGKEISLEKSDSARLYRIGAVSTNIRYDNFSDWDTYYARSIPVAYLNSFPLAYLPLIEVCVRVNPEEDHDFINRFRDQMTEQLRIDGLYLNTVQSIPVGKRLYQNDNINDLKIRLFIILFLLVNIFLGITGTFWFRTQYRRGEIGLRIAMGNTPRGILGMYYTEGILLLILAMIPAMIIFVFVAKADILYASWNFNVARYFIGFGITCLLLLCMIILGIWFPARKAVNIPPAEALRDE